MKLCLVGKVLLGILLLVVVLCLPSCEGSTTDLETPVATHTPFASIDVMTTPTTTLRTETLDPTLEIINAERDAGMAQGEEIVQTIEQFKRDTGDYPDNLESLVPEYLSSIPVTSTGKQFQYRHNDVEIYVLGFYLASKRNSYCCYIRSYEIWECGIGLEP